MQLYLHWYIISRMVFSTIIVGVVIFTPRDQIDMKRLMPDFLLSVIPFGGDFIIARFFYELIRNYVQDSR